MNSPTTHLSDDALDDILLGAGKPSDETHLSSCIPCTARLEEFHSSMALFNQASKAWSDARANTISRQLVPRRSSRIAAWSLASATALAAALVVATGIHRDAPTSEASTVSSGQTVDRQQEIAGDNAMLVAIDSEISRPVPSPVDVYGIAMTGTAATRRAASREAQD